MAENIVAILVNPQVLLGEFGRFDPEFFGNSVDIAVIKDRADAFAAIGATQAIDPGEGFVMQRMNAFVQIHFFVMFSELFDKSLCLGFDLCGTLPEAFCIVIIHWAGYKFFFAFVGIV